MFDKGFTPNWTEEIFKVDGVQFANPVTYKLKELLRAKQGVFRIEKVIRLDYKKKLALVKWKGYNDNFNSWIPMKDLKNI